MYDIVHYNPVNNPCSGLPERPRLRGRDTCPGPSCVQACSTPGIFEKSHLLKYPLYPFFRVWAKKLRAEVMSVYPAFRRVECDMMEIRAVGKRRIDRMYYLDTEQQQRYDEQYFIQI